MQHKLVLVQQTERLAEWQCPVCQRHVRLNSKDRGIEILNPGDQFVNHGSASTVPGLNFGQPAVEKVSIH